jgi:hypothetical protein
VKKLTEKYTNAEAVIPKMFASRSKGNLIFDIIKTTVVVPPIIIEKMAAKELGFLPYKATKIGTNKPETIKAYE